MAKSAKPVIINDPIHGSIAFSGADTDQLLLALIATPELQRLRRIKQLGFASLVYPAAEHSRFPHSLGAMEIARRMLAAIRKNGGEVNERQERIITVATLLHDIGHGPFSHAFEPVLDPSGGLRHEQWSAAICEGPNTEVAKILSEVDSDFPRVVANAIHGAEPSVGPLGYVVSSQLDADRCDFLLRDAHAAGVSYGQFDINWLIRHIAPHPTDDDKLMVKRKARHALEAYLYARHHMYHTVYFHKTARAAEKMLEAVFRRANELAITGDLATDSLPVLLARRLTDAAIDRRTMYPEYLALDDALIITILMDWCANASDNVLRDLCRRLLNRDLFKCYEPPKDAETSMLFDRHAALRNAADKRGLPADYYVLTDEGSAVGYATGVYLGDPEEPTSIFVEQLDPGARPAEAAEDMPGIRALKEQTHFRRWYFPEELREAVEASAGGAHVRS